MTEVLNTKLEEYLSFTDFDLKLVFRQTCNQYNQIISNCLDLYYQEVNNNILAGELQNVRDENKRIQKKYEDMLAKD